MTASDPSPDDLPQAMQALRDWLESTLASNSLAPGDPRRIPWTSTALPQLAQAQREAEAGVIEQRQGRWERITRTAAGLVGLAKDMEFDRSWLDADQIAALDDRLLRVVRVAHGLHRVGWQKLHGQQP